MRVFKRGSVEQGAVAIMLTLIFVFVLLPLAAVGLSSFTRSGSVAELQRAADSGALAGAASIQLVELEVLIDLANGFGPPEPLKIACDQAMDTAALDDAIGEDYAGPIDCDPAYLTDPAFIDAFGDCILWVLGQDDPSPEVRELLELLEGLLPALAKPGIKVTLTRSFQGGPVDGVVGRRSDVEVRKAAAKRRFKNLVVQMSIPTPLGPVVVNDRDEILALMDVLGENVAVLAPQCADVIPALKDDYKEASSSENYSSDDIIDDAQNQDAAVIVANLSPAGGEVYQDCGLSDLDDISPVPPVGVPTPPPLPDPTASPSPVPTPTPPPADPVEACPRARGAFRASLVRF